MWKQSLSRRGFLRSRDLIAAFASADANTQVISVHIASVDMSTLCVYMCVSCVCVCVGGAHTKVIGQSNQHSAVVHEAGQLAAVVQLPVPGEEQRRLETHGT